MSANSTQWVAGTCIVSAGVLLMLLDGGADVIFSAIAGTSAYVIHNMTVNDIPKTLKDKYKDEMSDLTDSDRSMLTCASLLAAAGVVINPWVGVPALAGVLMLHMHLQAERDERFHIMVKQMGLA